MRATTSILILFVATLASAGMVSARPIVPPGMVCGDPIAGTWRGRADNPAYGYGEVITVTIQRAGHALRGRTTTDYWTGLPGSDPPATCAPGIVHRLLDAAIVGSLTGTHLEWSLVPGDRVIEHVICGGPSGATAGRGHSVGTVDPQSGIFEARFIVDSPGRPGASVRNVPVYYRRIACDAVSR